MVHWQLRMAQQRVLAAQYLHCANTAPECCQHSALLCLSVSPASFPLSGKQHGKEWWYPLSSSLQHSVTLHGDAAGRRQGVPNPARDAFLTPPQWFPRQGRVGTSAQHHLQCEPFSVASALAHTVLRIPWPLLGQQIHPSLPRSILSSQDAAGVHHWCIWLHSSWVKTRRYHLPAAREGDGAANQGAQTRWPHPCTSHLYP